MEVKPSAAELKRRELVAKLTEVGFVPPPLPHRTIYSHADVGQLPYIRFPDDGDLPFRSEKMKPFAPGG